MAGGLAKQSADLALTRYTGVSGSAPLLAADSWGGLDLRVVQGEFGQRATTTDLATVAERENLAQALMLRLLTEQGALAPLGHPQYGCRLVTLIGRLNTTATRNLARLYVIEALRAEPRVRQLTQLDVLPAPGAPDTIRIELTVEPLHDNDPLALSLDIAL